MTLCLLEMVESINEKKQKLVLQKLKKIREKDFTFSSGRILGSMCTKPHPIAIKAYIDFLETNLGDPELFLGTKEIEQKYIKFILNLLHSPNKSSGIICSGGTEGNITGIWIAKNLSKKKEVIIPKSAHFSFNKTASLMGVKLVSIPLNNEYVMDFSSLKKKINSKTAAVVGIAGTTELGLIDPIPEISDLCFDEKIFLHVDAAFGGFVIPFMKKLGYNTTTFDFSLKGVSSITIDAHKMGYSAIPLGIFTVREKKWLDEISVKTPYLSSINQSGILSTRSGGPVAAAYAVSKYLGIEGYKNVVERCLKLSIYTSSKIKNLGLNLVKEPFMNVIAIKLKNPEKVVKNLTNVGWKLNKMDRLSAVRIVIMPHISKKIIDSFLIDFKKVCEECNEI